MPFVPNYQQNSARIGALRDKEKNKINQLSPLAGPAAATPQTLNPPLSAAQPTAAPQGAGAPSSIQGGNFINLQDYLNANQGQGKGMADKAIGGLEAKASRIAGSDPNVQTEIRGAKTAQQMAGQSVANAARSAMAGRGQAALAGQMPTAAPPAYLQGEAEATAAQEVSDAAKMAAREGGQEALLDKAYGSGRSQGESDFDNALMGASGQQNRFQELSKKYSGVSDMVQGRNQLAADGLAQRNAEAVEERVDNQRQRRDAQDRGLKTSVGMPTPDKDPWSTPESEWEIKDASGNIITDPVKRQQAIDFQKKMNAAKTPEEKMKIHAELARQAAAGAGMSGFSQPGDYSADHLHQTDTSKWFLKGWGL